MKPTVLLPTHQVLVSPSVGAIIGLDTTVCEVSPGSACSDCKVFLNCLLICLAFAIISIWSLHSFMAQQKELSLSNSVLSEAYKNVFQYFGLDLDL